MNDRMLLLDLDGVTVYEIGHSLQGQLEILSLHETIAELISSVEAPVVVLTHRSKAEAVRILSAASIPLDSLAGVMAAEDLFFSAVRHFAIYQMLRGGLRKSLILPELERRFAVTRQNMALIDDRLDNVDDMLAAGLGLVLHAPSEISADGASVTTFDFSLAIDHFRNWSEGVTTSPVVPLPSLVRPIADLGRTGLNTRHDARHTFNRVRRLAGASRRWMTNTAISRRRP
ncbi:hypothetical protein ACVWWK_008061 [Bradyrhizobium sp. LB9.1b]